LLGVLRGARVIEVTESPFSIKTWITEENGNRVDQPSHKPGFPQYYICCGRGDSILISLSLSLSLSSFSHTDTHTHSLIGIHIRSFNFSFLKGFWFVVNRTIIITVTVTVLFWWVVMSFLLIKVFICRKRKRLKEKL
jgi:hypothetical protein